jgi:trans-2,3-dihydro-3-hydroxyanthranilate isomerase
LDVFTARAFCGNPLAVFPEADDLSDAEMQQIAREMNLSETVFVRTPGDARALRRLRIFTPTTELPLAGHPVVGAWNALARAEFGGIVKAPESGDGVVRVLQELGVGVLPVDIEFQNGEPSRVVMTQGRFVAGAAVTDDAERAEIARSIGLTVDDLDAALPIQTMATGIQTLAVPVRSLDALGRCEVESSLVTRIITRAEAFSLYAFTGETFEAGDRAAHARLFAPAGGIMEDPATGSAAGSLGAYLVHHAALDRTHRDEDGSYKFTIEQGDFMKRASRIGVEIEGTANSVSTVRVGGESVVVATGELVF